MRRRIRGLITAVRTTFGAAPTLSVYFVLSFLFSLASLFLLAFTLKLLVDAIVERDVGTGIVAGLVGGVSIGTAVIQAPIGGLLGQVMIDRAGAAVDRKMMTLANSTPGLELHDRPAYLTRLMLLLRDDRFPLTQALTALMLVVTSAAMVVGVAVVLALQHPLLMLLPLFIAPVFYFSIKNEKERSGLWKIVGERERLAKQLFAMSLTPDAGQEVRLYGLLDQVTAKHRQANDDVQDEFRRVNLKDTLTQTASWGLFATAYVVAVLIVTREAVHGRADAGDVVLVVGMGLPLVFVTALLSQNIWLISSVLSAADRFQWLHEQVAAMSGTNGSPAPSHLRDGIRLTNVSFAYPEVGKGVLHDVDLALPAGGVVALVGENGAGKTTLVKLLTKMYQPTSGTIRVDAQDLATLDATDWRTHCTAGFQDFMEFEFLAQETIGIGDAARVDDQSAVRVAAKRGGADDVEPRLPTGWNTQLGSSWEGGVDLSTGQWQRLALARAFMRDNPLLTVLDEPTAALDPAAEHALFDRFTAAARRVNNGGITLLVSHRFSTVRMADLIVVLDNGRVVDVGTHTELISNDGLYAELYELQAQHYR